MKQVLIRLLALLLVGSGMLACSPSPPDPTAVRIRWANDPGTLDPLLVSTPQAIEVSNLLHCSLLLTDPESLQLVPWLAEALPVISRHNNRSRLTYTLRPEAVWDNGRPVLATDVAYTLKVLQCPGLPTEYTRVQYGFVQDIELDPTNPRRFTLVCASSTPEMLIASSDYAILPEYSLDPRGTLRAVPLPVLRQASQQAEQQFPTIRAFAARYRSARPESQPTGGPYRVTSWVRNRSLRLARKPQWWGNQLATAPPWLHARPARIDYQIIPDQATALLALRRGNLDLYPMPPARDYLQLQQKADTSALITRAADSYLMTIVGFNTEQPVLRDAATRRALSVLFDVDGLIQATQPTLAYRSVSLINPRDTLAYNATLPLLAYSPARALHELRAAGWQPRADQGLWRGGQQLAVSMTYLASNTDHESIARQFRAAARQIGIPVTLRPTESHLLQQQLAAGAMQMYVRYLAGSPISYNFAPILHSSGIALYNYPRFRSPENDRLIMAINEETEPRRRAPLVRRYQVLLRQEAPLVVLFFTRNRLIARRSLAPVQATRLRPGYDVLRLQPATL